MTRTSPRYGRLSTAGACAALLAIAGCAKTTDVPGAQSAGTASSVTESPNTPVEVDARLRAVIAEPHRSEANRRRDKYRHPLETLEFFGIRDNMTVVELWPGRGGWYTEILAPFLAGRGKLLATNFETNGAPEAYETKSAKSFDEKLQGNVSIYGKVQTLRVHPPVDVALGAPESADMVVTFRNIHNWMQGGYAERVFRAAFEVLKHGGVFGVEEHRAKPGTDPAVAGKTGYVTEATVVELAQKAGFRLAAKSEINANPNDTKDYPEGVWTLPPALRLEAKDREKYEAIGESDRMTLKFIKP